MRRLLILLLLVSLCMADNAASQFQSQTSSFTMEIGKNWQLLSVMALIISVILVAIAYVIGIGLEMPEMKAWAGTELVQVIANAIIIALLIVTLAFIELVVLGIAAGSNLNVPACMGAGAESVGCLQGVTDSYLSSYIDIAESNAKGVLKDNVFAAGMMGRRIGLNCITIFCAQIGASSTIGGQYIVKTDMYMIIFDHYTNLIASMEAQKFFVDNIAFRMGPVILAMGVVARSFFVTRKLGGLLIAMAAGMMFFFPGMYIFDWVTLDNVLNGDKGGNNDAVSCPDECKAAVPLAYVTGGDKLNNIQDIYDQFKEGDKETAQGLANGSVASATATAGTYDGKTITSCYAKANSSQCPLVCRELPYPSVPLCLNLTEEIPQHCADVPKLCKVVRKVVEVDPAQNSACPAECKVVPPLKSDCNTSLGDCASSSPDCRMAHRDDLDWRPEKTCDDSFEGCSDIIERCNWAADCPASLTADDSCTYVMPPIGLCNDLCADCPAQCRIGGSGAAIPDDCPDSCSDCFAGCTVRWSTLQEKDDWVKSNNTEYGTNYCTSCPINMRLVGSTLPVEYYSGACSYTKCPKDYREAVPYQSCEMCLFTEESYAYDPPINTQCSDICKPSDNTPVSDPSAFTQIGDTGLVGLSPVQNIAKLMIPAYLLPLFNIVATIIFIKGLSDMLGGDIEIPGLAKVF